MALALGSCLCFGLIYAHFVFWPKNAMRCKCSGQLSLSLSLAPPIHCWYYAKHANLLLLILITLPVLLCNNAQITMLNFIESVYVLCGWAAALHSSIVTFNLYACVCICVSICKHKCTNKALQSTCIWCVATSAFHNCSLLVFFNISDHWSWKILLIDKLSIVINSSVFRKMVKVKAKPVLLLSIWFLILCLLLNDILNNYHCNYLTFTSVAYIHRLTYTCTHLADIHRSPSTHCPHSLCRHQRVIGW